MKHTDRKEVVEMMSAIGNIANAEYHIIENVSINMDKLSPEELENLKSIVKHLRETRVRMMEELCEKIPEASGFWCAVKHLLTAEIQSYEIFERNGDTRWLVHANSLKIVLDDLLSVDSGKDFKDCPRCEEDKKI